MFKKDEQTNQMSCLNRAHPGEMVFTLLARDQCAPEVIEYWCNERVKAGKNSVADQQIQEALECARIMRAQRKASNYTTEVQQ